MAQIHVACCFDAAMQSAAAVLARSIAATTRDAHVTLHMLHLPLPGAGIAALKRRMDSPRFTIIDHPVEPGCIAVPASEQAHLGTYMRLLLPSLLDVGRVIYIDCDMIVRRSLAGLYASDLGGTAVAAVADMGVARYMRDNGYGLRFQGGQLPAEAYCRDVVGLDLDRDGYLSAGMMVMDLAQWRAQDLAARCLAFSAAVQQRHFHDQDAINHVLKGRFARLDQRWNALSFVTRIYANPPPGLRPAEGDWARTLAVWDEDPWIIHYAGHSKLWLFPHVPTGQEAAFWRVALTIPAGRGLFARYAATRARHAWVGWRDRARAGLRTAVQGHPLLRRLRPRSRLLRFKSALLHLIHFREKT